MIGVVVPAADQEVAREFFELLKTPWEFVQGNRNYDVVLSTLASGPLQPARLHLVYGCDADVADVPSLRRPASAETVLRFGDHRLPIYGDSLAFPQSEISFLSLEHGGAPLMSVWRAAGQRTIRVGYDLFAEVRRLLTSGQPAAYALVATLDLHAELLRELITRAGLPHVEIPPVPPGHRFIACLTHDIDHPVLRNHRGDHTMYGFLYRASVGSALELLRRRKPARTVAKNWMAVTRLPFVHLGLARDFWAAFDRYVEIEAGCAATYFFIPERDNPGRTLNGPAPAMRACRYTLQELKPQLGRIAAAGCEIGVHGIDAWRDAMAGRRELQQVAAVTGRSELGVRMHWLYYSEESPRVLEEAGFSYDSSVGYNDAVGYRAGTSQVYRPLGNNSLLELPLHIMDTALFYPIHLNLPESDARSLVDALIAAAEQRGGVLTFNWHDRSIAPERLWEEFYREVIDHLRARGAWFASASQAVGWFRQRRRARVSVTAAGPHTLRIVGEVEPDSTLPGLQTRVYAPRPLGDGELFSTERAPGRSRDLPFPVTTDFNYAA